MKVSIIGLGYVGLPLLAAIAKKTNNEVVGYDISAQQVMKIQSGECPIDDLQCEQDMKELDLKVSSQPDIIANSDIFIICVPTPVLDDYIPDLEPVKNVVKTVSQYLKKGSYIIVESTINPGVCDEVVIPMIEQATPLKSKLDFHVAHCPERINPGDTKWNVYNIPRNIGSTSKDATAFLANFYRSFISGEINEMPDLKTAEATKIIENTFRDINIAFVNELAKSFHVLGIDLMTVIQGASNKPFAFMPHYPGCGVGGHCIPVDPYYLIERAGKSGFDHKFLKLAREINNSMPAYTLELLTDALNEFEKPIKNTNIGLLGLSYKAEVGDLRESPALKILNLLKSKGANVWIYDPCFTDMNNVGSLSELLEKSFAIVLATNHSEFIILNAQILQNYEIKVVIDGRNYLNKDEIIARDIYYKGIGR